MPDSILGGAVSLPDGLGKGIEILVSSTFFDLLDSSNANLISLLSLSTIFFALLVNGLSSPL
jgi:hypothetical protein